MERRDEPLAGTRPADGTPESSGRPEYGTRGRLADGGLYLIVTAPAIPHEELVKAAVERAIPIVQLREKELPENDLVSLAGRLVDLTRGSGTLLVINDRPDIAAAVGADGVHLGRSDVRPEAARRLLGAGRVVGVSGSTPDEAIAARDAGADYIGVGPIFPTMTKPDARAPVGTGRIRIVADAVPQLPIVAVGGIDSGNAAAVIAAGADYAAVISAVCHAADPVAALDAFLDALSR